MISSGLMAVSGRRKTPKHQLRLPMGEDGGWTTAGEQMGERVGLNDGAGL